MKTSLTVMAGLLFLLVGQVPAFAQSRANVNERISAIEEELNLLRDVAGEAATSASGVDKKLASIQKSIADAQAAVRRIEDLEAANRRNTEVLKVLYAQSQKLTALEKEVAELSGRASKKKVTFKGQLRVRPYFLLNSQDLNDSIDADDRFNIDQRARIGVTAQATEYATVNVTLQDARLYGAQGRSADGSTAAFVHEAYASFTPNSQIDLRVGRQEWNFGAGRIIGNNDWESAARSFDGLDFRFTQPDIGSADLLFAIISERQEQGGDNRYFGGLYATGTLWAPFLVDLYALYNHDPLTGADNSFGVFGLRAHGQIPNLTQLFYDAELAWQLGRAAEGNPTTGNARENDHYAAFYHLELGYVLDSVGAKPWVSLFLDWSSADQNRDPSAPDNVESSGWISLFPTRHAYLGNMDLFELGNIRDLGAKLGANPTTPLKLEAAFHYLTLVSKYDLIPGPAMPVDAARLPSADDYLGTELDFSGSWDFSENFQLAAGWSIFIPGAAVKDQIWTDVTRLVTAPDGSKSATSVRYFGGDPAHYLWLQADLRF